MHKLGIRALILGIFVLLALGLGWVWWNDANSPFDLKNHTTKIFVVSPGESVRTIATRLKNEKLIKDQIGFFLQVKFRGMGENLQAGDFRLSPSMSVSEIINELTHGTLDAWVTTLEGWRVEEIALKLAQDLAIPEQEFLKHAREGYMFPDTYLIPKDASASAVVQMFLDNFEKKVNKQVKAGIENQGLTLEEGIVLASIVEREGRTATDRPVIAGILLKRLQHDWPLQADATLQYMLGYQPQEKTWWKKVLTDADKKNNSPYNTYRNVGLPPKPISNPGLAAINAAAKPQTTNYWYYLHDDRGEVHYAETLAEHEANIRTYLPNP